jgi:biotin synthase
MRNFKLTMASTSVFIPGECSNYRNNPLGNLNTTLNYIALMRIIYPWLLIPSTSSLEKAKISGQYLGLMAGANSVTLHDGTPLGLKRDFPIYSLKRFTPDERYAKHIIAKAHLYF